MAASTKQPFPVENFSGGITDNVFSGDMKSAQTMDNFVVSPAMKLYSRPGSVVDDPGHSPIPAGNQRIGRLINYARNDALLVQSARSFYTRGSSSGLTTGAYTHLVGPSNNEVLSVGTTANYVSTSEWNRQRFIVSDAFSKPMKIYRDANGVMQVRNVGLPALASMPTVTPGLTGTKTYLYAFIYKYTYTVGSQTFVELGPTQWITVSGSSDPSANPNVLSNIPVLSNVNGDNYDTANVQVQIYRTINNGNNFYEVAEIPNGQTTYTDSKDDTSLQTGLVLYTNDGTQDYYPAPASKFVHITKNMGLYGFTNDSSGAHPYRVAQSVLGNPGFVPLAYFVEVEDEIKGINSVKQLPIVMGKKIIYRFDGQFANGQSVGLNPVKIHNSAGCISNQSCVEAENYLFWAGNDGFYATDGYQVIKISDHLNVRYQQMLNASKDVLRIQGRFDEQNRRVIWAVQTNASNLENDTLFCLELRFGVSPTSTFTTWSGNSFRPTAIEVFNGQLYRGDLNGFVFYHDPSLVTDPRSDVSSPVQTWAQETIKWTYTSPQINFGSAFFRKYVSRILLQAENAGNTSIQITAINDQGKKSRDLKPIRWRRNVTWGDQSVVWGSNDCVWNAQGLIEQWRRLPAGGLRLSYLQIQITNAFSIVSASNSDGPMTLNKATQTAVLPNLWPPQSSDYVLYTSADNYTRGFTVKSVNSSGDTITLNDMAGLLPVSGSYDWELFGYEKGEPLQMLGFTLHWDNVDQNQNTYHSGDSGAN